MKKKLATKILAASMVGVMALGMTACGSGDTKDNGSSTGEKKASSDTTVGIVVKTATNAHFQDIAYGAMLAGKDLGLP